MKLLSSIITLTIACMFAPPCLHAETGICTLLSNPNGEVIGTIDPGTTAVALDTIGEFVKIQVTCWVRIPTNLSLVEEKKSAVSAAPATPKKSYSPERSSGTIRCQATTKKGTQCKRNAKPGSDYCWQHQR